LKIFVLFFAVCLFSTGKSHARTEVGGPIFNDTVWTLDKSPYIVVQNIEVGKGVNLTIEPGVTVRFDGEYSLIISGTLIAKGTESRMINFTSGLDEKIKNTIWNDQAYPVIIALMIESGLNSSSISSLKKRYVKLTEKGVTVKLRNRNILIAKDSIWHYSISRYYKRKATYMKPDDFLFPFSNGVINRLAEIMSESIYNYIKFTKSGVGTVLDNRDNYVKGSILEYCKIKYANTGILSDSTKLLVKHCIISNHMNAGIQIGNASSVIVNNSITNNSIGIQIDDGSSIISNNTITNNVNNGIKMDNSNKITIFNNLIQDNGFGGIIIDKGRIINIKNNTIRRNYGGDEQAGGISIDSNRKYSVNIAILDNRITGNRGEFGGIYVKAEGKVDINDNRITSNKGGIYIVNSRSSANITKNTVSDNVNGYKGGIYVEGNATIKGNTIKNNSTENGLGGGIYIESGSIADNVIHNNQARRGGGIYGTVVKTRYWYTRSRKTKAFVVIMENNQVICNFASYFGGGICANKAIMRNNTIANNSCGESGSGIFASSSIMEDNVVTNNYASVNGGGIYASSDNKKVYIKKNTIAANGAKKGTDGIFWNKGTVTISDCNFYDQNCHLYNNSEDDIAAINNWWGTKDSLKINRQIYDFFDNEEIGKVNYRPFLSSLNSNAPEIPLIPPTNLTYDYDKCLREINLDWKAVNSSHLAGYKVYYDTDSKDPPYEGAETDIGKSPIDVGKISKYRLSGLKPGTEYHFAVVTYNISGEESLYSKIASIFVDELSDKYTVIDKKTIREGYNHAILRKVYPGDKIRVSGSAKELDGWIWGIRGKKSILGNVNSPYVEVNEKGNVFVWSKHKASRPLKVRLEKIGKLDFKGPFLVLLIGLCLISLGFSSILYQNKDYKTWQHNLVIGYFLWSVVAFLVVFVCFIKKSDLLFRRSFDENIKLAGILFGAPSGLIFLSHLEGVMMTAMRIKYIFVKHPTGVVMNEEENKENRSKKEKKLQQKKQEKESAIVTKIAKKDTTVPDVEKIHGDLDKYKGYLSEYERRFQERQLRKSIKVTRQRIEEAKNLYREGTELHKAKVDFAKSKHEYNNISKKIIVTDLKSDAELEEAQTRLETAKAKRELKVLRIEAENGDKFEQAKKEELLKQEIKAEILERNMEIRGRLIKKAKQAFPNKSDEEIQDFVDSQMVESGMMPDL